jgi:hypothetical protein
VAIAFVQSVSIDAGGATTGFGQAFSSNVTAGSLLVYGVRLGGDCTVGVTDTRSNTWTEIIHSAVQSDDGSVLSVWYAKNASASATTVNFTFSASVTSRLAIAEYSGIDTTTALDGTNFTSNQSGGATSTAPVTTTPKTPSQAASLVLGFLTTGGDPTSIAANGGGATGYTLREAASASNRFALEDKILAASSAQTAGFTLGAGQTYIAGLAIFNGAGGGGGSPAVTTVGRRIYVMP